MPHYLNLLPLLRNGTHRKTSGATPRYNCVAWAAGRLPSGKWTSKLGSLEDIEHELRDLEGRHYGRVQLILKRRR